MARNLHNGLYQLPSRHVYPEYPTPAEMESSGCSYNTSNLYSGTALACIERTDICTSETGECWSVGAAPHSAPRKGQDRVQELELESILFLLKTVLHYSSIYSALPEYFIFPSSTMPHPYGRGMGGIRYADGPMSLCARWEKVTRRLFETSLARIQIDIWDFARGTRATNAGYGDALPPAYRGLCKKIKFKAVGWKNLNAFWAFACLALGLFCWVGSMEFNGKMVLVSSGERLCFWVEQLARRTWELCCFTKSWFKGMVDRVFRN